MKVEPMAEGDERFEVCEQSETRQEVEVVRKGQGVGWGGIVCHFSEPWNAAMIYTSLLNAGGQAIV